MSNIEHHDLDSGAIDRCQICGSTNLQEHLDLGHQAPCDSLLWPNDLKKEEKTFPLKFLTCGDCSLAQIDYAVPPEYLFFPDYPYRSGITQTLVDKLTQTSVSTLSKFSLGDNPFVIDIGSNDGTVLKGFKERGCRVLGVEATNIAEIANENGIETIQAFFDENTASTIIGSHGHASVITATNVFAHISKLGELMRGISNLLDENGVFVTESHYIVDLLETVQYDSIYHEHLRYYSLKSLITLFKQYGFTVANAERISNYGGSIRVFAVKGANIEVSAQVQDILSLEESLGIYTNAPYEKFAALAIKARNDLQNLAADIQSKNQIVVGIGCPGRASTLVNFSSFDHYKLPYIAEQSTSLKLGLYMPGTHIPIIDEHEMFVNQPDYAILLSWHYSSAIIAKLRAKGLKSKIIIPLPNVTVIDP